MATREEALELLKNYSKLAGANYKRNRNYAEKFGVGQNVSSLSPYIRYRLISEEEVIMEILREHSYPAAEKFIQEVFWRTYWKGWMQLREHLYEVYNSEVKYLSDSLEGNGAMKVNYEAAITGQTGITCLDDWTNELLETGYLHNHVRMWFASIWTFTLNLPWQLGANFFMENLLDADQAVNTLSWRWVSGSQTKGKNYIARAENIHKYTKAAYFPIKELNESPKPIDDSWETSVSELPSYEFSTENTKWGLIIGYEDLSPETWIDLRNIPVLIVSGNALRLNPSREFKVQEFISSAQADCKNRLTKNGALIQMLNELDAMIVKQWTTDLNLESIFWIDSGVGSWHNTILTLTDSLARAGVRVNPIARNYDSKCWPFARRGFFKFKERIPNLIKGLGSQQELF